MFTQALWQGCNFVLSVQLSFDTLFSVILSLWFTSFIIYMGPLKMLFKCWVVVGILGCLLVIGSWMSRVSLSTVVADSHTTHNSAILGSVSSAFLGTSASSSNTELMACYFFLWKTRSSYNSNTNLFICIITRLQFFPFYKWGPKFLTEDCVFFVSKSILTVNEICCPRILFLLHSVFPFVSCPWLFKYTVYVQF